MTTQSYEHHTARVQPPRRENKYSQQKGYTPGFRLINTLYETQGFRRKDARDKVFDMLSLVANLGDEGGILKPGFLRRPT